MNDIDERVSAFYQDQTMDPELIEDLLEQSQPLRRSNQRRFLMHRVAWASAAVLLLTVTSVPFWYSYINDSAETLASHNTRDLVLREASMNHQVKLKLDFETPEFDTLASNMAELSFEPSLPTEFQGQQLIGGRYCTIVGNLAAHVKLQDADGKPLSLFMTPSSTELSGIAGQKEQFETGVVVTAWEEQGLFYVLASSSY